nr:hypothetical protein [uncultured Deefgea sp.]
MNRLDKQAFSSDLCDGAQLLAKTLAVALKQRKTAANPFVPQHKYHQLIVSGILSPAAWQVALKESQKLQQDIEQVLQVGFSVTPEQIGASLAAFFGHPYEPFSNERIKPSIY